MRRTPVVDAVLRGSRFRPGYDDRLMTFLHRWDVLDWLSTYEERWGALPGPYWVSNGLTRGIVLTWDNKMGSVCLEFSNPVMEQPSRKPILSWRTAKKSCDEYGLVPEKMSLLPYLKAAGFAVPKEKVRTDRYPRLWTFGARWLARSLRPRRKGGENVK